MKMLDTSLLSATLIPASSLVCDAVKTLWKLYKDRHDYIQKSKTLQFIDTNSFHILNGLILSVLLFRNVYLIYAVVALLIFMKSVPNAQKITYESIEAFVKPTIVLIWVLFVENTLVYVVSYYDDNKFNYTPSQDHFYNIAVSVVPWWNDLFETINPYFALPGADDYLIVALLWGLAAIMNRIRSNKADTFRWAGLFVKALIPARIIRTIAFTATVMPNPQSECFSNRFELVRDLDHAIEIMTTVRFGGCNDLVISGHTLFICMLLYVVSYAVPSNAWGVKVMKFITPVVLINIVMGRHHYSVDVFLAVVISMLIWDRLMLKSENMFKELEAKEKEEKTVKKVSKKPSAKRVVASLISI